MTKATNSSIKVGTAVLTYNQWTGYEDPSVRNYFSQATNEDILKLEPGDAIWFELDPIHPNGKVYGFVKTEVTKIVGIRIYFLEGCTTHHRKIFFVDDETTLAGLIAANPKMTDVVGDSGRMANELIRLYH